MIQKDYILRMIEEIGRFLAELSAVRHAKDVKKGYDEFFVFINAHFNLSEDDFSLDNLEVLEEAFQVALDSYPDELGQLLAGGAETAREQKQGSVSETLYFLAWQALKKAEDNTRTFRFERQVEMNAIKKKLGLMGINVQ